MLRWQRHELANLVSRLLASHLSADQLGEWLSMNFWRLPTFLPHRWAGGTDEDQWEQPILVKVPIASLCGTSWLFEPAEAWPREDDHWIRLARLLEYSADGLCPKAVDPISVYRMSSDRFWVEDGCHRAYSHWLCGCERISAYEMGVIR